MVGLAHKDDMYESPLWIICDLQIWTKLTFNLDASANSKNSKCDYYIGDWGINNNALTCDWNRGVSRVPFKGQITSMDTVHLTNPVVFNNPPRSKNGKFVTKALEQWNKHNIDIVQLLCWNDLGNKYGEELLPYILDGDFEVKNLGKVIFDKDGKPSQYPSRLTYFALWMKKRP